jgi:methionyl aminopeptidase
MIALKTPSQIELMKEGGAILKSVVDELTPLIKAGITTREIDKEAEKLLQFKGAKPSFKTVKGYSWSTCLPINHQAVHTPPSDVKLQNGDILTIDIGALYKGFHTDYAITVPIGKTTPEVASFLKAGKQTLDEAIALIKEGVYLGEIGEFIYNNITNYGYSIMKDLSGHGIGKELHEDPYVLNYLSKPIDKTYRVKKGLTIAVEIIYSMGAGEMAYESVPWSIITKDSSLCACFEKSIAISDKNTFILT